MKKVLVYQVSGNVIGCSNGECLSNGDRYSLDFLLKDTRDSIKLFTNLDDDVSKLLRILNLSKTQLEDLANVQRCVVDKIYTLMYIPGKWFSIDKGYGNSKQWAGFSDLSQYHSEESINLDRAKAIAEEVYYTFADMGYNPNNLISPSNVYRKEVLDALDLPSFDDVPLQAMEIAYECCKGNWVESFAIGKFDKVWDYDINSAFPSQAAKLLDLRLGTWKQSNEYQKEATYGYCRCEVSIDSDFSPIIKQYGERSYTPKGVFQTSLTKNEIDFINQWNIGFVTIIDGWWWTFNIGQESFPLLEEITKLYALKQSSTGIKREIIKRIMSGSFYGLFIELRNGKFGDKFMAPYAAEIEANTRLEIASLCMKYKVIPLHIAVDGIVVNKPIHEGKVFIDTIGQWRLEHEGAAIIASSGLACIQSKTGKGDFSINYDELMQIATEHPEATEYTKTKKTVLSLGQAKAQGNIFNVGIEKEIVKTIDFGDNKREYEVMPENFGELVSRQYASKAWNAQLLDTLETGDKGEQEDAD